VGFAASPWRTPSRFKLNGSPAAAEKQVSNGDSKAAGVYIDRHVDTLALTDSRPTGPIARHKGEFSEVKVVFLILNLAQHIQMDAGKLADENSGCEPMGETTRP
jgi:hypothetical protein